MGFPRFTRRRFLAATAATAGLVGVHGVRGGDPVSWPIQYADSCLPLGSVMFPATCPALPALRVNETQPVNYSPGWWRFDVAGIYYWESASACGLLLIRSFSRIAAADMVLRIVAASATGADDDSVAFYDDPVGESLRLFTQPGQRRWNCGPQARAMGEILASPPLRIATRVAQWLATDGAHQDLEVDLNVEGGWTLYDPHFGLMYMPGFDGLDLWQRARAGEDTRHYLRDWQPETPWHPTPWTALEHYALGFGVWDGNPVPIVSTGSEAEVERALGADAALLTPEQMRAAHY